MSHMTILFIAHLIHSILLQQADCGSQVFIPLATVNHMKS